MVGFCPCLAADVLVTSTEHGLRGNCVGNAAQNTSTHGSKTYYLYAKDRQAYFNFDATSNGQVIVKEAWVPKVSHVSADDADTVRQAFGEKIKYGLFVMMKLDSAAPNTDDGWIYGLVAADDKTVNASGRVASCMSCHDSAPHGKLFGLPGVTEPTSFSATVHGAILKP